MALAAAVFICHPEKFSLINNTTVFMSFHSTLFFPVLLTVPMLRISFFSVVKVRSYETVTYLASHIHQKKKRKDKEKEEEREKV